MDLPGDDFFRLARLDHDDPDANLERARRLVATAQELLAIARDLDDRALTELTAANMQVPAPPVGLVALARKQYRERRLRTEAFTDETLFGEPAWDILLDLYIAACEGKRTPVTSACIGAAVPTTTALRWLAILEKRGLIVREADVSDARRFFVRLSADALDQMNRYFERAGARNENGRTSAEERPFMLGK